jgi:hypothetical protein
MHRVLPVPLNIINEISFIMEMHRVLFEVRTEFLNIWLKLVL